MISASVGLVSAQATPRPSKRDVDLFASIEGSSTIPRLLLVFAHPDDEVLAAGARLELLKRSRILTLTDGAPSNGADALHHGFATLDAYRRARRDELLAALADAELPALTAPVFSSVVPDQMASFALPGLARAIAEQIRMFRPDAVLTHPYEGGHPDHDACAFAVHAAMLLAAPPQPIRILESPFYHADENGSMVTGSFLPGAKGHQVVLELNPEEQRRKARRLACFSSQQETLAQFSLDFEAYRVAPTYNFTEKPCTHKLLYEYFPWGMTGDRFCELASEALGSLFPEHPRAVLDRPELST